ncbi:MAG: transporter [Flavobacteriaceae bacterium]|nr:transporter [Flavobacteriaceae bacterium]
MKLRLKLLTLSLFSLTLQLRAQNIVPISQDEVMEVVQRNSATLKIAEQKFLQARADYRQSNAVFLPNISASHTGIATTNPLAAFGVKLNQQIVTQRDFNPDFLNNPSQIENYTTRVEFQQPLVNMDGLYQRKAASATMQAVSYQKERTAHALALEVRKAYMQLQLAYKGVDVMEKTLKTVLENKRISEDRLAEGYLQPADLLNVEVRVAEVRNQLQSAKSQVQNASNFLSYLIGTSQEVLYRPSDSLYVIEIVSEIDPRVPENRPDLKAQSLATNARESMVKASKMEFLPELNAFGSYELHDDAAFQGAAGGYLVGAQLSWNLFQGSKRLGKVQKAQAELQQSKLEYDDYLAKSQLELNQAQRYLMDTKQKLELAELAVGHSAELLRIRTNRYKEGLEKTADLLLAETQLAQKQLELYQTIYEYNYAQAVIEFLTKK